MTLCKCLCLCHMAPGAAPHPRPARLQHTRGNKVRFIRVCVCECVHIVCESKEE